MKKRPESSAKAPGERARKSRRGAIVSSLDKNKTRDVQHFLKVLQQISLTLHALGYLAEGDALAQVKTDLHHRIYSSPQAHVDILKILH